jgi:hypothetical protein
MKRSLIISMLISIGLFLFTACETNQPNMHNKDWHWGMGMGWGTWIVLFLVIAVILYFLRTRKRK